MQFPQTRNQVTLAAMFALLSSAALFALGQQPQEPAAQVAPTPPILTLFSRVHDNLLENLGHLRRVGRRDRVSARLTGANVQLAMTTRSGFDITPPEAIAAPDHTSRARQHATDGQKRAQ